MKNFKLKRGFTLSELLIVIAIMGILLSLTTINLFSAYYKNNLNTSLDVLLADLRQQQLKAMVADTQGASTRRAHGIYFKSDSYVLYQGGLTGNSYLSTDPFNFEVKPNEEVQFTNIFLPNSQVLFASNSGEIVDYDPLLNYVTLKNIHTEETKTIRFNQFGTVDSIY